MDNPRTKWKQIAGIVVYKKGDLPIVLIIYCNSLLLHMAHLI